MLVQRQRGQVALQFLHHAALHLGRLEIILGDDPGFDLDPGVARLAHMQRSGHQAVLIQRLADVGLQ